MEDNRVFKAQANNDLNLFQNIDLPLYFASEFTFYRCVKWEDEFYGNTISKLFNGNLRDYNPNSNNRYAKIFSSKKISYWSNSPKTAYKEINKHCTSSNVIIFEAYDDSSSAFSMLDNSALLTIVDGRKCGIQIILDKLDMDEELNDDEIELFSKLFSYDIDCIVYDSHVDKDGENYLFFENGFKKLALKSVKLRFSKINGGNHNYIELAHGSDYLPSPELYGSHFDKKTKIKFDKNYLNTDEYLLRKQNLEESKESYDFHMQFARITEYLKLHQLI